MKSFTNSWNLVKASARVLGHDKELLLFPVLSAVGTILVCASFLVPIAATDLHTLLASDTSAARIAAGLLVFLFYLCCYFVIFFCNAALVGAALIRLRGGDPTVADGLRIAARHAGPILVYALISATVGLFLRWLSERAGLIGRIIISLIGAAWAVATYLVVPILVTEQIGAVDAVRRSTRLLKQTFGEQLVGNLGMGAFFGWLTFALFAICIGAMVAAGSAGLTVLLAPLGGLMLLWVLGVSLVSAALRGIYTAAVYRYVVDGQAGDLFEEGLIRGAFRAK